jgi:excisionase family DNA binding protein
MTSPLPHDCLAGIALGQHSSVKAAAQTFGYNEQYLRRLLRSGQLEGMKIGQVWLIKLAALEQHLQQGRTGQDRRRGP